jgi:hypothetical protein
MYKAAASKVLNEAWSASRRTKILLLAGFAVSIAAFELASRIFGVPINPGFGGNLLGGASPISSVLVVGVTLLVCVLLSTLIAGTVRFDAGLFCATLGMFIISCRAGTMGSVLRETASIGSASVFIHLALELVVEYAVIAVAWSFLWTLHKNGNLRADEFRDGVEDTDEPMPFKASAMAMQVGVMALCIMLLGQSDAKAQVVAAVGISAFVGACAAYYMYPISPSPWLWVGPMIVGVAGYVLAYFNVGGSEEWKTGQLTFGLAPLARALPLDYATAGPAGAILGYWMSRKWHRQRIEDSSAAESTGPT